MVLDEKILARLDELVEAGTSLCETPFRNVNPTGGRGKENPLFVNNQNAAQWGASCLSILSRAAMSSGDHYRLFEAARSQFPHYKAAQTALGVLIAAKEDYQQGMLFDTRNVITAEVFEDFLEQAEYLLSEGNYYGPAAVIAGCVLEDGLRQLCARNNIAVDDKATLNTLNTALYKAQIYSKGAFKQNDYLGNLRNDAAHGYWDRFGPPEVDTMIRQVRTFMLQHFS